MQRRDFLRHLSSAPLAALPLAGMAGLTPASAQSAKSATRPNIVLIMADDMGFSDIAPFGGEIDTPNLSRLAANGLRLTQFYNTARCCPTRASLLTGLYPHQAGIGHMMQDYGEPGYRGDLNRNCVTIAEALRAAGYATAMTGKWHVTPQTADSHNWPLQRGFDRFYGTISGAGSYFDPDTLTRDNQRVAPEGKDYYYTDAIAENAATYIQQNPSPEKPLFLYVAFTAPHWPMHAPEASIAKYARRYEAGWDKLRLERHARQKAMGLLDRKWELSPRDPEIPSWEDVKDKPWQIRRMAVYAAMVDHLDRGVGKILAALQAKNQLENTLILFLADNGGCAEGMGPRPQNANPNNSSRPEFTRDKRLVQHGNKPQVMPGPEDTYQSYGPEWAHASNTPFRLYKHWVHEGGISSPFIAHWPKGLAGKNRIANQPGHLIDIMATCLDVAGAPYPQTFQGQTITPLEGKSLLPIFQGKQRPGHAAIFWEHEGNQAVRMGPWKLVKQHGQPWELYNLANDRTESNNLAAAQPQRVAQMAASYDAWAARSQVLPWQSWQKKGRQKQG